MIDRHDAILEEKLTFLFEPDILIPAQYFDSLRSNNGMEPEKRLMSAVLGDAVRCYQDNLAADSEARRRLFEAAEEWLLEEGADWAFSFRNICEALGLSPEYVRRGLRRWKERQPAHHPDRDWEPTAMAG